MKTTHISKILDRSNFSALSAEDSANIRDHAANCQTCSQALRAARISAALLQAEASAEAPVPNAFFQAKVLSAWRERQNIQKPLAGFRRWWQASAAMVFSMVLMVGGLVFVSFLMSDSNSVVKQTETSNYNLYSADSIILNQKMPKDLTTGQAFEVLESSKLIQQRKNNDR